MKAVVYRRYGSPDVLRCEEVERPTPKEGEVLVRVRAASVNPMDRYLLRGRPYPIRAMTGLFRPKESRLGVDLAGEVEAVGGNVTDFQGGEAVFGSGRGAFAEYACVDTARLAPKPGGVSFEHAAAAPVAGLTALQGIRDFGNVQAGQKVLITGAAGGVGTFAVQIAKSFGAEVTGVCSTRNVDHVRSIGADYVIDYTREDFTRSGRQYDVIVSAAGNRPLSAVRRVLAPGGSFVWAGGPIDRWVSTLAGVVQGLALSRFGSRRFVLLKASVNRDDLAVLGKMLEDGRLRPVIGRRYTLGEVPDAIRYLEEGHARGKTVIVPHPGDGAEAGALSNQGVAGGPGSSLG